MPTVNISMLVSACIKIRFGACFTCLPVLIDPPLVKLIVCKKVRFPHDKSKRLKGCADIMLPSDMDFLQGRIDATAVIKLLSTLQEEWKYQVAYFPSIKRFSTAQSSCLWQSGQGTCAQSVRPSSARKQDSLYPGNVGGRMMAHSHDHCILQLEAEKAADR